MELQELKEKLKNGEVQFLNDNHDSEMFCELTNVNFNGYNYYYGHNEYSSTPFDVPVVRLSEVI